MYIILIKNIKWLHHETKNQSIIIIVFNVIIIIIIIIIIIMYSITLLHLLYYYMNNFSNLIGLEQWYFSLIWNTYMWKLQTFAGSSINK